ncbi:glycoside hydrolase family 2 TIM barrel-domain containing protein [Actinomadura scrupuli]|uniref:glycoside hydrolase family 2 TIM barrel-domain containing protein n=1 Tax=Actinomadura scrupuli TaxID=559629 RepID=UPI003D9645B1
MTQPVHPPSGQARRPFRRSSREEGQGSQDARRAEPASRRRSSGRRRTVFLGLLATGIASVLVAPASYGKPAPHALAQARSYAPTFAAPYLNGVSGPEPTRVVSLDGPWDFTPVTNTVCTGGGSFGSTTGPMTCVNSPAGKKKTTIQVPGGGWLKQGYTDLSKAVYSRTIRVPDIPGAQVTRLNFGAVNHRATLWVDGRQVGSQVTSYTSSVFDISAFAEPGTTHEIKLLVQGRKAMVGPDGRYNVPEGASWSGDVAQGIFRSAELEVFPSVFVSDTVVRTSVAKRQLSYDVYVSNNGRRPQDVVLDGRLGSWNGKNWKYPAVPERSLRVPAGTTTKVTVGPLDWRAGPASYWLPNVPYRAGYRAQLHDLVVRLTPARAASGRGQVGDHAVVPSQARVRFGFREIEQVGDHYELNGERVNFRGDSLQGANYDNIDFHGRSDAYDTFPGFLRPSMGNGGWPKAVDDYLRLNYSGVRIHQIPATPYMLDVSDELGLMVQDETAIRGSNNRENFVTGRDNMIGHLAGLVRRDRNHASVLRWSQANEPRVAFFTNPGAGPDFDEALYATVMSNDTTRPISTDGDSADLPHDNYTVFCHYDGFSFGKYTESTCAGPQGKPHGQGEFIWWVDSTPQGMAWFGTASMRMREKGASDTRPYTLLSAWSSVIPGVKRTDMKLEINYPDGPHPIYGEDNLPDPWANPTIKLIQNAFNPVAVIDSAFWDANKMSDEAGDWPTTPATVAPGRTTRLLTLFNDTFQGERLNVTWRLRSGSPAGRVLEEGRFASDLALGSRRQSPITFTVPDTRGPLYLDLQVSKPGEGTLYRDASTVYSVQHTT